MHLPLTRQSARGLAQSKTLARLYRRQITRSVLDCGSPLPLWLGREREPQSRDTTLDELGAGGSTDIPSPALTGTLPPSNGRREGVRGECGYGLTTRKNCGPALRVRVWGFCVPRLVHVWFGARVPVSCRRKPGPLLQ